MQFLDWVSVVSSAATVAATVLALIAIVQSARQAKGNAELIVAERRRDVQLDALARLGDALAMPAHSGREHEQRRWVAETALAVAEAELPLCRIRFGRVPEEALSTALGLPHRMEQWAIDRTPDDTGVTIGDRLVAEVAAAIKEQAR